MCGTPLPHRPLTTPGAQNTWNLTRLPLENARRVVPPSNSSVEAPILQNSRTATDLQGREPAAQNVPDETIQEVLPTLAVPQNPAAPVSKGATDDHPQEMVPEVSLNEYVSGFRYVPVSQAEELTIRSEHPVLGREVSIPEDGLARTSAEAVPVAPTEDVIERLGLEPMEDRSDRPRFLDVNHASPPTERPATRASSIVGPSFLGLSDTLPIAPESEVEPVEEPRRAKWRVWLAVAVVLVLAALGILQWRSQVRHANNGPVEIVGMTIRDLLQVESSSPSAKTTGPGGAARTERQAQQPPEPKTQDQSGAANVPGASETNNQAPASNSKAGTPNMAAAPVNQPDLGQNAAAPSQLPSITATQPSTPPDAAPINSAPPANGSKGTALQPGTIRAQSAAPPPAEKPKPKPPGDEDAAVRQPIPGEEEMAKARNASDAAAQAAWLWKATAKGNPEAPVTLANMFIRGDGVPRSCEQALVLLKSAAAKQNARARNRLGSMYASGVCVQRNPVEAYRWFSSALAANPNSPRAQDNRALLWQQMTPEERALAEKYR